MGKESYRCQEVQSDLGFALRDPAGSQGRWYFKAKSNLERVRGEAKVNFLRRFVVTVITIIMVMMTKTVITLECRNCAHHFTTASQIILLRVP